MDHKHTTDINFQQSWLHQERNRMQQPAATIASHLDGPRTDDRRVPSQRSQASQPHRPYWWTPGEDEGTAHLIRGETTAVACRPARIGIAATTA
eukprot:6195961-Pleurochrysis_carterae.AAC.1